MIKMVFDLAANDLALRLVIATVLGGLIGLEREFKLSPAGIKTYSVVSLGSALFAIIAFEVNTAIASGVIIGIGFLGAGVIFKDSARVHGLTTAALIWMSAAIGMTVGFGYYTLASVALGLVFVILVIFRYVEKEYVEKMANGR